MARASAISYNFHGRQGSSEPRVKPLESDGTPLRSEVLAAINATDKFGGLLWYDANFGICVLVSRTGGECLPQT